MKSQITKRQKQLLSVIYRHVKNTGYPPSFEEMREKLGVASNQSIIDFLDKLKQKKFIKKEQATARGISILPRGYDVLNKPPIAPLLGTTSAGVPTEAIEITGEWKTLPSATDKLERLNGEVFLLKISGDSMINAGINDGDIVLIKTQKEFISGDIVLAHVGQDATIKRFISEDKPPFLYLKPENPKYDDLFFTDDTQLTGKVISVLKNGYWKPVK